jgi:hypothetical protein
MDPIGRLTLQLRGATGDAGQVRGGAVSGHLRLGGPSILAEAFLTEGLPGDGLFLAGVLPARPFPGDPDARLGSWGAEVGTLVRSGKRAELPYGEAPPAGGLERSTGRLAGWLRGSWSWTERLSSSHDRFLRLDGSGRFLAGSRTDGEEWKQWIASAEVGLLLGTQSVSFQGMVGKSGANDPDGAFRMGGIAPLLVDPRAIPELRPVPYLPAEALTGHRFTQLGARAGGRGGEFFFEATRTSGNRWSGRADALGAQDNDEVSRWTRGVGFRIRETLDPMPFVRIPALELDGGSAWVSEPDGGSGTLRSWISFRVRP